MSIKILGGVARGLSLDTPSSLQTRPTSVMLKRRIFDANQDLSDFKFYDLCAGTGQIGFEALSRGALSIELIDNHSQNLKILKNNLAKMTQRFSGPLDVVLTQKDCLIWVQKFLLSYELLSNEQKTKCILFFDPPYEKVDLYQKFAELMINSSFRGQLWIEACTQKTMEVAKLEQLFHSFSKVYQQGTSYIAVCKFECAYEE